MFRSWTDTCDIWQMWVLGKHAEYIIIFSQCPARLTLTGILLTMSLICSKAALPYPAVICFVANKDCTQSLNSVF